MPVIVTRPEREAQAWVRDLVDRGLNAVALPLIDIVALTDQTALQARARQIEKYLAVMFVSSNAADFLFASNPDLAQLFSDVSAINIRAWSPGLGTVAALLRAGVAPSRIDSPDADSSQFDSEALWQVVGAQVRPGSKVLIVRGGHSEHAQQPHGAGRDWFARQVTAAEGHVDFEMAYLRKCPEWSTDKRGLAQSACAGQAIWLFSSSEAIENLKTLLPEQDWKLARAVVTHPRIGAAARAAGFTVVRESRPALDEIIASIESLQ
jgi:uroporphyrinogen-III synthase